ncbi:MFS transporter [Friedmanniella luteola]|uniref:MFS transporter n=1 Tax=Friedmanniella luteola TaxID=546871 RepID=UPI001E5D36BC|nr:MFS transporter [Friedmanniella luteola]
MTVAEPAVVPASPFAPFRHRAFFWLWLGVVVASIGAWAQTVGAQWLFINDPNAATIVPLVQTASTLPMMLLALPAGVLADAFDRRLLLVVVQGYSIAVSALLAVLTVAGMMPPALLLTFTFAVGAGLAMLSPTWQSLITELVPREEFAAATRLDMVSVNVSRAAGPAIAGWIIATWGVAPVFALTAAAGAVLLVILLTWRRSTAARAVQRERFVPALRSGSRYVRHEPVIRAVLLRFASFVFPAGAVWALLPLIASRQLGLAASGYGLLFSALGIGAVTAALGLGRVKRQLSSNQVLAVAGSGFAVAFAGVAVTSSIWVALPLLVVCGFCWTATVATVISELQLFLPGWVRARAIAIYLMVFLGTQAVAAPVWGLVTQYTSLRTALLAAAVLLVVSVLLGLVLRVPESEGEDRSPLAYWDTPRLQVDPFTAGGPVVVSVEYEVSDLDRDAFLDAMRGMRRSRLRSGASRWELYRVGEDRHRYVEQFEVPSWEEHERQHEGRLTAEDKAIEDAAFAHVTGSPRTQHLLPAAARGFADDLPGDRHRDRPR